ncbi:MAG: hypothetical protein ACI8RZ_001943 [Myxococcota bacterium]|jgi:hypothetical protein
MSVHNARMNRDRQKRLTELLSASEPERVLQALELARSLQVEAAACERVVTDLSTGRQD